MGVEIKGSVLPATVQCPLCSKKALDVYQDLAFGGQWGCCRGCHFSGDMIELLRAAWKVNTATALHKVKIQGVEVPVTLLTDEAVEEYERLRLGPRNRVREFWKQAQEHFMEGGSPSLRELHKHLGVQLSELGWLPTNTLFVGSATAKAATLCLRPGEEQTRSNTVVFRGKGWGDVLVLPFYDLPGRICAFQFIGRGADPEHGDLVFRHAPEFAFSSAGQKFEAGVAMADVAWRTHPRLGSTIFVVDDPCLALQLQFYALRTNMQPLPVIAIHSDAKYHTERIWEWLPAENVIVWSPRINDRHFAHARQANASISAYKLPYAKLEANLTQQPIASMMTSIKHSASLWEVAVRRQLEKLPPNRIEELFIELGFNDSERRDFIKSCTPDIQERLRKIYESRPTVRRVQYGKNTICESEGCWYVNDDRQSRIANAIVRIEKTLRASNGRSYYQGIVLFEGKSVDFLERTDRLDKNLWKWCSEFLRDKGVGIPNFTTNWDRHAFQIATLFCKPQIINGVDTIGWDPVRRQFNFPQFAIDANGELLSDYVCLFRGSVTPAEHLPPPSSFTKDEVAMLGDDNDESRIFWAVAAGVASNIVAPAVHAPTQGIILDGPGAQTIGKMSALYTGCPELPRMTPGLLESQEHTWPIVFELSSSELKRHQTWLMSPSRGQAVMSVGSVAARILGIRQHWNIIRCQRKLGSMQLLNRLASRVLPSYLEDLCSRKLYYEHVAPTVIESILRDMADWFLRTCHGDSHVVLSALDLMELPESKPAWEHFIELVYELLCQGRLQTVWSGFDDSDPKSIVFDRDSQEAWLPQRSIIDGAEALAGIQPDTLLITKTLQDSEVLLDEREHAGHLGWVLRSDWLEKQFETVKKGEV